MDAAARVLAECAASPDDDAPRLVWADLVGGERGELVTIQCDLARGELTPAEVARRRRRERELLDAYGVEWAGSLASCATRWRFRRGFIESAKLTNIPRAGEHPLLATFEVATPDLAVDIANALPSVRGFACAGPFVGAPLSPMFHDLRALAIDDADALTILLDRAPIELLSIRDERVALAALRAPKLVALEVPASDAVVQLPVRALRTTRLVGTMFARLSPTLEYLAATIVDIESFDHLPALRRLHAGGNIAGIVKGLLRSKLSLRELRFRDAVAPHDLQAIVERFGAELELLELPAGTDLAKISIAGELRVADTVPIEPLLHPASLAEVDRPCFVQAAAACIARVDREGPIWDIPPLPADQRVIIGRGVDAVVHIPSDMISRRHAGLYWRGTAHVLRDLGSENATYMDGARIDEVMLDDGDEFQVGNVMLQYFTGSGARQRADEAVAATRGLDPDVRLPRHDSPPFEVRVMGYDGIVAQYGSLIATFAMRTIAEQLERAFPGEKLWHVRPGVFGIESAEVADRIAGPRTIDVAGATIEVQLGVR